MAAESALQPDRGEATRLVRNGGRLGEVMLI